MLICKHGVEKDGTVKINWREMEAGRELDAYIESVGLESPTIIQWINNKPYRVTPYQLGIGGAAVLVPKYSTDLNDAFKLLEQLPLGEVGLETDGSWFCVGLDDARIFPDENATTPALAICWAWLAWIER